jgi:hypothetical protein
MSSSVPPTSQSPDPLGEASVGDDRRTGPGTLPDAGRPRAAEVLASAGGGDTRGGEALSLPEDEGPSDEFPFPVYPPLGPEENKAAGLAIVDEALELVRSLEPDVAAQLGLSRRVQEAMLLDMKDDIVAGCFSAGVAMWHLRELQRRVARDPGWPPPTGDKYEFDPEP